MPLEPHEVIEAIIDTRNYETSRYLVIATKLGQIKKTEFKEYDSRNAVLIAIKLQADDEVVAVRTTMGKNDVLMFTAEGAGIRFKETDIRGMGRDTQEFTESVCAKGDRVVSAASERDGSEVLLLTSGGYGKRTKVSEFRRQGRGGMGVKAIKLTKARGTLVAARALPPKSEIFVTSTDGVVIRMPADSISRQKRRIRRESDEHIRRSP